MSDLSHRLAIKASMIELGEKIAWGSDSAIMREAAAEIERLHTTMARLLDATAAHHRSPFDQMAQSIYNDAKRNAQRIVGLDA